MHTSCFWHKGLEIPYLALPMRVCRRHLAYSLAVGLRDLACQAALAEILGLVAPRRQLVRIFDYHCQLLSPLVCTVTKLLLAREGLLHSVQQDGPSHNGDVAKRRISSRKTWKLRSPGRETDATLAQAPPAQHTANATVPSLSNSAFPYSFPFPPPYYNVHPG